MDNNEQWKLNGDCRLCRRKNYCNKPCTACKRDLQASVQAAVVNAMDKMTGGAYSEIMERCGKND